MYMVSNLSISFPILLGWSNGHMAIINMLLNFSDQNLHYALDMNIQYEQQHENITF